MERSLIPQDRLVSIHGPMGQTYQDLVNGRMSGSTFCTSRAVTSLAQVNPNRLSSASSGQVAAYLPTTIASPPHAHAAHARRQMIGLPLPIMLLGA